MSTDDDPWGPSRRLLTLAQEIARWAPGIKHPTLDKRDGPPPRWYIQSPGDHYSLLTAVVWLIRPKIIWEFGTEYGMSAVSMMEGFSPSVAGQRIYTVDLEPWQRERGSWIDTSDVESGRIVPIQSNMSSPALFEKYKDELTNADLFFIDGPKDLSTEVQFLELMSSTEFKNSPILIFDDTRQINMVMFWRGLQKCKMDITSFGHWSGTGLVDWCTTKEHNIMPRFYSE